VSGRIGDRRCGLIKTGIGQTRARRELIKALESIERPAVILSIGLAGALDPRRKVGEKLVIHEVGLSGGEPRLFPAALHCLAPGYIESASRATLLTLDQPALTPAAKAALARGSAAELCDMETHAVAMVAAENCLPWLGARIVSDSAQETLKPWVVRLPALIEEGNWLALARQLGTHPQDLPRLIGLAYRMSTLQRQLSQFIVEFIVNVVEP
jgi:nucleoside phosphorylase